MAWHGMGQTGWDRMGGDLARLDAWQGRLRSFRFTNTTAAKPNIGPEPQWQPTQVACLSRRPSECNRHNRMRSRPFGECPHVLRAIARSDNNTAGQRVQRRVSRPRLMQIGAANSSVRGSAQWQASEGRRNCARSATIRLAVPSSRAAVWMGCLWPPWGLAQEGD